MITRAVRFGPVTDASMQIGVPIDSFEMSWVHAVPNTAKVVEIEPLRDRTDAQFVGESVGVKLSAPSPSFSNLAVSVFHDVSSP